MSQHSQTQAETTIYRDTNVFITNYRLIVGQKTYVLNTIGSIQTVEVAPQRTGPSIFMAFGIIMAFSSISQFANNNPGAGIGLVGLGLVSFVGSLIWFLLQKPEFALKLGIGGNEVNVLTSQDQAYILNLTGLLNSTLFNNSKR